MPYRFKASVFSFFAVLNCLFVGFFSPSPAEAQFIAHMPFTFGSFNGTVVSDGSYFFCDNVFTAPVENLLRVLKRSRGSGFPFTMSSNVVVVDINGMRVVVDTGVGPDSELFPSGWQLLLSLQQANISPESIDAVFLTHAHIDHFGGLVNRENKATFPNARLFINKVDHEYWLDPKEVPGTLLTKEVIKVWSAQYKNAVSKYEGRFTALNDGEQPLKGVTLRATPGHSPGHSVVELGDRGSDNKGKKLVVLGDQWQITDLQVANTHISSKFDSNQTMAAMSRRKVLRRLLNSGDLALNFHRIFPGLGYIRRKNKYGFEWVTANIADLQPNPLTCASQ